MAGSRVSGTCHFSLQTPASPPHCHPECSEGSAFRRRWRESQCDHNNTPNRRHPEQSNERQRGRRACPELAEGTRSGAPLRSLAKARPSVRFGKHENGCPILSRTLRKGGRAITQPAVILSAQSAKRIHAATAPRRRSAPSATNQNHKPLAQARRGRSTGLHAGERSNGKRGLQPRDSLIRYF